MKRLDLKTYFYFFFCVLLLSCNNSTNSNFSTEEVLPDNRQEQEVFVHDLVKSGWIETDDSINYVSKNAIEKNLIGYFHKYSNAIINNDIEFIYQCSYLNGFRYLFEQTAEIGEDFETTMKMVLEERNKIYSELRQEARNASCSMSFIISDIKRHIADKNREICVFEVVIQMAYQTKNGNFKYLHTIPKQNMGVSFDNGKKWQFIAFDHNTPNVLRKEFNDEMINKVMNY